MNSQTVRGILLDIEGTTSSISFVYDVMFPYVREHVARFLAENFDEPDVQSSIDLLAADLGFDSGSGWLNDSSPESQQAAVVAGVNQLMDADVKATGLKQLQGQIWKDGFHSGQLVAHVYDDVPPAIEAWRKAGIDVRIYSSGSIAAQKLFFGHTVAGDLLNQFEGHYDTTTGPKREVESYRSIATEYDCSADEILFVSDVVEELEAARTAGFQTLLCVRPGNKPVSADHSFKAIESFEQVSFATV